MQSAPCSAPPESKDPASTALQRAQMHREKREERRTREKAANAAAKLKAQGRESHLAHGRALLREAGQPAVEAMTVLLAGHCTPGGTIGRHHCALKLIPTLYRRPEQVVMVALRVILDQITRPRGFTAVAIAIGRTLENEATGQALEAGDQTVFRLLVRKAKRNRMKGRGPLGNDAHRACRVERKKWTNKARLELGSLLLDVISSATNLVEIVMVDRQWAVRPTDEALRLAHACRNVVLPASRGPMLTPPRPWPGLWGGGHLGNAAPLVRLPRQALAHLEGADISLVLRSVNHLQAQALAVDQEIVGVMREAWEHNIGDLLPPGRRPPETPPRPEDDDRKEWDQWKVEAARARGNADRYIHERLRIELGLQGLEELEHCWQAHDLDFRGRVYTTNRITTHQGPDWQKAAISFRHGQPVDVEGFEWLLKALAGHWGMTRSSWGDRLAWGKENIERALAVAANPLDQLDLWKDAKDPWQFLQLARAVAGWIQDPSVPIGAPVRLDQTTSGCGIIAALMRDARIGRLCNLHGDTPEDLYGRIAQLVAHRCELDLHTAEKKHHRDMAARWLRQGITRKMLKGPVLALPYGGKHMGTVMGFCNVIEEARGFTPDELYGLLIAAPAHYLAHHAAAVIKAELADAMALTAWFKKVVTLTMKKEQAVQWSSPAGWPVRLAKEQPVLTRVKTTLNGKAAYLNVEEAPPDGQLSARETRKAAMANLIHSFDAAFCHRVVHTAAGEGRPILTNHDCFATTPANAQWLHHTLLGTMGEIYGPDQMGRITAEISRNAGGVRLPRPPRVGSLSPGLIGSSPYGFS